MRLLLDCAEICRTSADFMIRGSDLHPHICRACAAVCARCADECDAMGDDPYLAACSEICRRSALTCAEMAGRAADTNSAAIVFLMISSSLIKT